MWEQIQANKRRSRILLVCMLTVLMGVGAAVGVLVVPPERMEVGIQIGVGVGLILLLIQYLIYVGTPETVLLQGMSAQPITKEEAPRLYNVVEEMTIAAGLARPPRVYVVDDPSPNAFAFGRGESSSVAVTTGLLAMMTRDELQGVVAHEIGHIRNRDVDFMTLAAVMLGTIAVLADVGWHLLRLGGIRSNRRESARGGSSLGQLQVLVFVVALVFLIVGPVAARLLYFASSRRREYLADASAAAFTRYPEGLASALEKIATGYPGGIRVNRALAPLYIVNPLELDSASGLFSTHPPLDKRIEILRRMGGASLVDYAQAARAVLGKDIVGPRTLSEARPQDKRPPSEETAPEAPGTFQAGRDHFRKLLGYSVITCTCGMTIKVPPTFPGLTVECPRCKRTVLVPGAGTAATLSGGDVTTGLLAGALAGSAGKHPPPGNNEGKTVTLQVARTPRQWQTIECEACGQSIELSPAFLGSFVLCPSCKARLLFAPTQQAADGEVA